MSQFHCCQNLSARTRNGLNFSVTCYYKTKFPSLRLKKLPYKYEVLNINWSNIFSYIFFILSANRKRCRFALTDFEEIYSHIITNTDEQ
jgi:hypothetical protein